MRNAALVPGLTILFLATCASQGDSPAGAAHGGHQEGGASAASADERVPPVQPVPRGRSGPIIDDESAQRRLWGEDPLSRRIERFVISETEPFERKATAGELSSARTYAGAPPPMPHSADFGGTRQTCLDCHERGMSIGSRVAHPMPHAELTACTQCHVEATNRMFPDATPPANSFAGVATTIRPSTATNAPPPMPHPVLMRGRCLSCHGEFGHPGLRVEHHRRASCTQCHVEEAPGRGPSPFLR